MDIYYEQNVVNNNIDERAKKTKTLSIAKMVCLVIGMFILVSSAMLLIYFWAFLLVSLPFFAAFFFIGHVNKRNNTEYDYVIDGDNIAISEIYFRERRKLKYAISLRSVESVGVFDSEGYKKIEQSGAKKRLALVNYDDEQAILYIYYNGEKGKQIMFLEPDRGFMIALRRCVSAVTVFDKSISDLEKLLSKKEAETLSTANHAEKSKSKPTQCNLPLDDAEDNSQEDQADKPQDCGEQTGEE